MKRLTIISFLFLTALCFGQKRIIENGEKLYNHLNYVDTQDIYQKVADQGYDSPDLFKRLADSYYLTAAYDQSAIYYGKLIEQFPDKADPESYLRYAISLRAVGDYQLSSTLMNRFLELNRDDTRAQQFKNSPNYLDDIAQQKGDYQVSTTSINSGYSDFGPMYYKDKLIFASNRDTGTFTRRVHKWNGQAFLNLYEVAIDKVTGSVGSRDIKKFSNRVNTVYHESNPVFTKDGNTVYFTRNNYTDRVFRKGSDKINRLKLYRAQRVNDKWTKVEELPFNSDEFATAHPALNAQETRLYFSSDRPGSFGESDLWYVSIHTDDTFGSPVNLGNTINTEGRESFPFISGEDHLYFSSTGHLGLGGLDLFVTALGPNGEVGSIKNLGEPVNTPSDDFSLIIDTATKTGFFSSNRDNTGLNDDIYKVTQIIAPEVACEITIDGLVTDQATGDPLEGVTVSLFDVNKKLVRSVVTTAAGSFDFIPECDQVVLVRAEKEDYTTVEKTITTPKTSATLEEIIELEKTLKQAPVGTDIGKTLNLNPIYFNFNTSTIRPDAEVELAKILVYMQSYPDVLIDVRSHTDSRGDDAYNLQLSEDRNRATIKWLTTKGINASRLTGKGYGESQPVNSCVNGVPCTSDQHQLNRRSEFIVKANN